MSKLAMQGRLVARPILARRTAEQNGRGPEAAANPRLPNSRCRVVHLAVGRSMFDLPCRRTNGGAVARGIDLQARRSRRLIVATHLTRSSTGSGVGNKSAVETSDQCPRHPPR